MIPAHIIERWQQALKRDRLIEWRSFAFLFSAEAKLSEVDHKFADRDAFLTLFEVALQHVYRLQPMREEA